MDARLRRHRGRNEYLYEGVQRAPPGSADESRVTEFGFRTSECGFGATSSRILNIKCARPWLVGEGLQFHKTQAMSIRFSFSILAPCTRARDSSRVSRSPRK